MISVKPAGRPANDAIFLDTINMINIKLCITVVLIELYQYIRCSVTLIVFQGHCSVKRFYLKISCSDSARLKLRAIVDYLK